MGMRRSGLHCICEDILRNGQLNGTNIRFINNTDYRSYLKLYTHLSAPVSNTMLLMEDRYFKQFAHPCRIILIVRDIYDNMISRIKKNKVWSKIDDDMYIGMYTMLLQEALGYSNHHPDKTVIDYNKYIEANGEYRIRILTDRFHFITCDAFSPEIAAYGGGKTFTAGEKRERVHIDVSIFRRIAKEARLLKLVQEYYGYNLLDKLRPHLK